MQGHCYLVVPADAAINAVLTADEAAKLAGEMAGKEPGTRFLVCAVVEERVVLGGFFAPAGGRPKFDPGDDFGVICIDAVEPVSQGCTVPPSGWLCTREPGHDGPCAAWPIPGITPAPSNLAASAGPSPTESSQTGLPQRCGPSEHDWDGHDYNNRYRCTFCGEQVKRSELPDRNAAPSARNLPARLLTEIAA